MKRIVKFLSVLSVSLLVTTGAYGADLYAHYDASNSATVTPPTGVVTDLADLSANGFDAGADVGTVLYPDLTPSLRNLDLLDMGDARNTLSTLTEVQQQDLLNFDGAAAGNDGFAFFVVARVDALFPTNSIIHDVILANRGDITAGLHLRLQGASPELYVGGVKAEDTSAVPVAGDTLVIAANYNKVTGDLEFWNSKANASVTENVPAGDFSQPNPIFLGGSTNGTQLLDGAIGEVKFYQGKLTTAQFAAEQGLLVEKWRETDPFITSDRIVNAELFSPIAGYQITTSTDVPDAPVSYAETGLPSGLTLDTATGLISGTPIEGGEFNVDLSATNSSVTIESVLVLTVTSPVSPTVEMTSPTDGSDIAYGSTVILSARPIAVGGGDLTVTYFLDQTLPDPDINLGTADASTEYALDWVVNKTGALTFYAVVEEVGVGQSAVPPVFPSPSISTVTSVVADNLPSAMITSITNTIPRTRVESGSVVMLRADVTGENGDTNDVDSVEFFVNGASVGTGTPSGSSIWELEWVPSLVGNADQLAATVVAVVTSDANAILVNSSPVFVDVIRGDVPTVNFITPTGDVEIQANQELDLLASAEVTGSTILEVQFFYRNTPGNPLSGTSGNLIGSDASTPYSAIFSRPSEGTYYVYAVATSTAGRTGFTTTPIKVTVVPGVAPTVGDVQSPVDTVTLGSTLPLSITAGDSDGTIASVDFYNGGVLLGAGTLNGTTTYTLNWTPTVEGTYSITAVATDDTGLIAESAVKTITVTANAAPTVGNVQVPVGTVTLGNTVTLSVTAGDSDGSVASVNFYNGSVLLGAGALSSGTTYTLAWTPDTVTTYNVTAIAMDNHGLDSAPSAIATTVTVAPNAAPTVGNVQVPVNTVTLGNTVTLSVIAGDSDGSVASVNFYNGSVLLGAGALSGGATYTLAWTPDTVTTYNVTAIATDNHGLDSAPSANATTVTVAANAAPTVGNVQVPVDTVTLGSTLPLSITAGDSDGTIASVDFYNGSVKFGAGTLSGSTTYTLDWTPTVVGTYSITAVATDDTGLITRSAVKTITVVAAVGLVPSVDLSLYPSEAGAEARFITGSQIAIYVNALDDDGSIISSALYVDGSLLPGNGRSAVYIPATEGFKAITAVVVDDDGNVASTSITALVIGSGPRPSVSIESPVVDQVFYLGDDVVVRARVDSVGLNVDTIFVLQDGRLIKVQGSDSAVEPDVYEFTVPQADVQDDIEFRVGASYDISYQVRDGVDGNGNPKFSAFDFAKVGLSSAVSVDVQVGAAPEVAITGFADGDKLAYGSTIAVPIRVTPLDSSSTMSVELFANGVSQGFAPSAPYSVNYTVDQTGTIELFAVATETLLNSTATRRSATVRLIGAVGQAPVVSAVQVPVNTVTLGNIVTLSVTAGDSDGTIDSVKFYNGSVLLGAGTPSGGATYTLAWTPSAAGTYALSAIAQDNEQFVGTSAIAKSVRVELNTAPTVGNVQVPVSKVTLGNTVRLSVIAGDSDGSVASVNFYNGSVLLGAGALSGGTTYTLAWTPDTVTTYNVTAIATDNHGLDSAPSANATPVTVADNTPPTVGNVQVPVGTVTLGNTVTLSVTAGDSDGSVASVNFYNGSVLLGAGALSGGATYTLDWTPSTTGEYSLIAVAQDNEQFVGTSLSATSVTVAANIEPTVGNVQVSADTVTLGDTVTLSVIAGDSDGSVASVNFYNGSVLLGVGTPSGGATYTLDWTPDAVTTYNVTAIATDNYGLNSAPIASATTVTVEPPAPIVDPTVSFVSPIGDVELVPYEATTGDGTATGGDEVAPEGATVTLRASATVVDGTISQVEFFYLNAPGNPLLGTSIGVDTSAPYTTVFSSGSVGTYYIYAVATSNTGGIGVTTESIQVTVAEPVEPVVTFVAPTAGDVVEIEAREILNLLASAEVEGGTISGGIRFYFRNTPGDPLLGTLIESVPSAPYTTEFSSLSEGIFYLYAVATSFERITGVTATPIEVRVTYSQDELFINNIFDSILGRSPTDSEVADGLEILDGSLESQTAYVVDLLDSSALDDTDLAMLVNRTMLGEWPDAEELAFARANLSGGTVGSSSETGSIEFGATETFEFFYNVGDAVTMRVTQDSAAGNPLTDATLTVNSPSGAQVGFSNDSIFGLDPLLTFTATEAGTHTAIVGGFSQLQAGDFTITSFSTGSGSSNAASAQSLVTALIPEFESRFRRTFPPVSIAGQAANNLVTQLFRNKHSTAPDALALNRLSLSLTGVDTNLGQLIVPGYSGSTAAFVAAFALDNQLSQYPGLSSMLYYTVPNDATEDMQTALLIVTLLDEDPTDAQIAQYAGMTIEDVVEAILIEILEPSASTWTPEGWVYYDYPYAYSLDEARWHYFDSSNTQWRVNLTTNDWGTLSEATGWTFYAWPYSYSVDASTWHWYNGNEQWVVDLVSGVWALFGD